MIIKPTKREERYILNTWKGYVEQAESRPQNEAASLLSKSAAKMREMISDDDAPTKNSWPTWFTIVDNLEYVNQLEETGIMDDHSFKWE